MSAEDKKSSLEPQSPSNSENQGRKSLLFRLFDNNRKMKKGRPLEEAQAADENKTAVSGAALSQDKTPAPQTEAPPQQSPRTDDLMPARGNYLNALVHGLSSNETERAPSANYSDFMLDGSIPTREERTFLKELQNVAKTILDQQDAYRRAVGEQRRIWEKERVQAQAERAAAGEVPPAEEAPFVPPPETAADAVCYTRLATSGMLAWVFLFPPRAGGADITADAIRQALEKQRITYGVDDTLIQNITDNQSYFKMALVARGKPAVDGMDGYVDDLFPRVLQIKPQERDNQTVDYKDLGWLHQVHAGDIICHIVPPSAHENGIRVTGEEVKGRVGREAIVPKGQNTQINEAGTALTASMDGQVSFKEGKFKVDQILTIKGDVDNTTGNLDAFGDIIVNGDVRDGFTVKATGSVTIKGMAEGAWIIAGENIQVGMGMNGSGRGVLDAKGDVKCKYLENCTVNTGGTVYSDSIINCNIYCNDQVMVKSGRGVIIGGSITAANLIACRVVGNQSSRPTSLILGSTPSIVKERAELSEALQKLMNEIDETDKSIVYLQTGRLTTPEQQKLLNDLKLKAPLQRIQKANIQRRLRQINRLDSDLTGCQIRADTIYPPTQLTIGSATMMVQQVQNNCNIFYSDGELRVGSI